MSESEDHVDQRSGGGTLSKGEISLQEHQNPPLVAATPLPVEPTTVVDDAEAVAEVVSSGSPSDVASVSTRSETESLSTRRMTPPSSSPFLSRETSTTSFSAVSEEIVVVQSVPITSEVVQIEPQESLTVTHEVVQIDAVEESPQPPNPEPGLAQNDRDKLHRHLHKYCCLYLAVSVIIFVGGIVGIAFVAAHFFSFQTTTNSLPAPSQHHVPTASPHLHPTETEKPSISLTPSQMPSCSGNYNQVSSVRVAQSGSNHFTMSENGQTLVVANFDYQLSTSFLETFVVNGLSVVRTEGREGYFILDAQVSGDGSRLVLALNSHGGHVGGAMIELELVDADGDDVQESWRLRHEIQTGGGVSSAVYNVAVSSDGTTIAFLVNDSDGFHIQVQREYPEGSGLEAAVENMTHGTLDRFTIVELSGNGDRLFVASDRNLSVFEIQNNTLVRLGESMEYYDDITEVRPSFNGSVVALGSFHFPVAVYEEREEEGVDYSWYEVGDLDITTASTDQLFALSGDGRNVLVGESFSDGRNIARLFRRSGPVFAQVQDMTLKEGSFRGMQLSRGGERLVVAIEEELTAYRKDCAGAN